MICSHPIRVDWEDGRKHLRSMRWVPCGRCTGCRVNRAEDWANRMVWESSDHKAVSFITLTYSVEFEPVDQSVDKRVLQLFFKRLRKELDGRRIKYFGCGEYGERHGRPHYHAIVFGLSVDERAIVEKCWGMGFVGITPFIRSRALYVARYVLKEVDEKIDMKGRARPFALMSKRLGLNFALRNRKRIEDGVEITMNGQSVAVPRYFRKVLDVKPVSDSLAENDSLLIHLTRVGKGGMRKYRALDSIEQSREQSAKDYETRQGLVEKKDNGL